jgi:hypothetical protein
VIAAHEGVATVPEPWLLLPSVYSLRTQGIIADYVHPLLVGAIEDFCQALPGGQRDYEDELRRMAIRLYEKAAGPEARFFVDKSPYSHVAADVMRVFPDAKCVFLWRNPLGIVASLIETWEQGRWYPTMYRGDLFIGLPRLASAYSQAVERAHSVRFEDLIRGDDGAWRMLMDYLGIEFDPEALRRFSKVELHGRMGDPTGTKRYAALSTEPLDKWRSTLANPVRIEWCRRFVRFLGRERLEVMGYSQDELLRELDSQPLRLTGLLPDLRRMTIDIAKEPARVRIRRQGLSGPNVVRELLRA